MPGSVSGGCRESGTAWETAGQSAVALRGTCELLRANCFVRISADLRERESYAAPIGAFFCPEIRAFTEFWGEISSTVSKALSDRRVLFKHKNGS